jgi:hypothetical protein
MGDYENNDQKQNKLLYIEKSLMKKYLRERDVIYLLKKARRRDKKGKKEMEMEMAKRKGKETNSQRKI